MDFPPQDPDPETGMGQLTIPADPAPEPDDDRDGWEPGQPPRKPLPTPEPDTAPHAELWLAAWERAWHAKAGTPHRRRQLRARLAEAPHGRAGAALLHDPAGLKHPDKLLLDMLGGSVPPELSAAARAQLQRWLAISRQGRRDVPPTDARAIEAWHRDEAERRAAAEPASTPAPDEPPARLAAVVCAIAAQRGLGYTRPPDVTAAELAAELEALLTSGQVDGLTRDHVARWLQRTALDPTSADAMTETNATVPR
jgi:hypothetical protein